MPVLDSQTCDTCGRSVHVCIYAGDHDDDQGTRIANELRARLAATYDHECNQWCTEYEHHNI